jgi:endothelin-converting enzyme
MREVYRKVMERLILSLSEDESTPDKKHDPSAIVNNAERTGLWPPWPWPPWDGDDGDKDDGKKKPNKTEKARKLSEDVLKFETRLANASLDL